MELTEKKKNKDKNKESPGRNMGSPLRLERTSVSQSILQSPASNTQSAGSSETSPLHRLMPATPVTKQGAFVVSGDHSNSSSTNTSPTLKSPGTASAHVSKEPLSPVKPIRQLSTALKKRLNLALNKMQQQPGDTTTTTSTTTNNQFDDGDEAHAAFLRVISQEPHSTATEKTSPQTIPANNHNRAAGHERDAVRTLISLASKSLISTDQHSPNNIHNKHLNTAGISNINNNNNSSNDATESDTDS